HVGGQVDTDDVESDVREDARRRTGAAANVGDDAVAGDQSGEPGQHRAVQRPAVQVVVEPFGVGGGGEVVTLTRVFQEAQFGHVRTLRTLAVSERAQR